MPNWAEQFGRVLIEAMACGVPPVCSSSGAMPGVVADAGIVFPEGDVAGLHRALAEALQPERAAELRPRGMARVAAMYSSAAAADALGEALRVAAAGASR
jgi:glycosyltransferase involved in cell wall biosynthesis